MKLGQAGLQEAENLTALLFLFSVKIVYKNVLSYLD